MKDIVNDSECEGGIKMIATGLCMKITMYGGATIVFKQNNRLR